ncbi:MAG: thiamine phosphate synthase [Selenomonadaceae bacterium]|nr:thiamine phosphate synthase [Selenomonadaceae bacterium]
MENQQMKIDLSAYLIVGPENVNVRSIEEIITSSIKAGFTCLQLRSKISSAKEMIELADRCAKIISDLNASDHVALIINDRLDIVLEAREMNIKVDGVHVGQNDISPEICRKYLGDDAIVGFTPKKINMIDYVKNYDLSVVDYLGVGPFHISISKPDAGRQVDGSVITRTIEEISEVKKISPVPVIVGGGVTIKDLPILKKIGVDGFFVISAVAGADDPYLVAKNLVECWRNSK